MSYLTVKDVADHFQVSARTVDGLIRAGLLKAYRIGHVLRLRRWELPDQLPRRAARSRRHATLPESGVYLLYRDGALIYVGRSGELPRRITNHRRAGRTFDRVEAIPCEYDVAQWLEAELIRTLRPPENVKRFARRARRVEVELAELAL